MTSNLKSFKDLHSGKRCFILGNGPSLKDMDLSLLSNEICLVVNWFPLTTQCKLLNNFYYCISDQHFWNYGDGMHHELLEIIRCNSFSHLFIESSAHKHIESAMIASETISKISYLNYSRELLMWENNFQPNIELPLAWGRTVILDFCVPVAQYMGFSEIYLIGCDCDYKLDEKSDFSKSYFFPATLLPKDDLKHLERQRDVKGSFSKHHEWFASYQVAWEYLSNQNIIFKNATVGGMLNSIPRVDFRALFKA